MVRNISKAMVALGKQKEKKMKKLILLVSIAVAMFSQAASVSWASGVAIKGPSDAYMAAGAIKMYVFEFASQAAYDAADIASLDVTKATLSGATTKSTTGITLVDSTTYSAGNTIYSAVVFTATDSGKDYYMGAKFTDTVDDLGSDVGFGSLKSKVGSWTARGGSTDIPEPTSGILLLVGGAMLALRRKRA